MMVRFMPHFSPIPSAPRLLCLYLFLSFRAMALGQVHLQGVWIEMHWSFTHWKQACSPFFFFFFFFVSNSLSSTSFHCRSMHEFSSITRPKAWICGDFKNVFLIDQMEIDLIWGLSLGHSAITHSIVFFVLFIYLFFKAKRGNKMIILNSKFKLITNQKLKYLIL